VGLSPILKASIAFSFIGGKCLIHFLEGHEIDGYSFDDADRDSSTVEDDAEIAYLGPRNGANMPHSMCSCQTLVIGRAENAA